jgi:ketosteroid isomerase-like protein
MAESLLERIRAGYEAWNEGNLDRTLEFLDPDVEWHTSASFPGTKPIYRGHEGFKEFWGHLHEPWDEIHIEIESYTREGDVAILRIRFHGTSKASGVSVDLPWFQALVIEDDRVMRSALDRSIGDALEALDVGESFPEF